MLSRNCIHCLAPAVRRAAVVTPTFVPARSVTISTNTRKPKTKPKPSTKPKPAAADGSVPAGPLPTDPLAPPPPSSPPPLPPYEPRATSAILDDEYLRPKRWISDPGREDNKLSPYAYMGSSFARRCIVSRCQLPRSFMLKIKAARVDDNGSLAMFPEDVQHPKYVPAKTGKGLYVALHPDAVKNLLAERGSHILPIKNIASNAVVPSNLPEMVDDMLGKRVVQELEIAQRVIRSMPREFADYPFFRPLSKEQEVALKDHDELPNFGDAKVIAVLDVNLREPIPPTLLHSPSADGTAVDPDVPVFPLKLASHAPQAAALVRSIVAMERRRATSDAVAAAQADVKARVEARARAEGVTPYEAGTEAVADDHGQLPQEEIDAATDNLEAHRRDEEANFVAITVPPEHVGHWRATAVPLVVALLRVGLYNGIGWDEEAAEAIQAAGKWQQNLGATSA